MDFDNRTGITPKPYKSLEDAGRYVSPKLGYKGKDQAGVSMGVFSNFCKKISVSFNQIENFFKNRKWVNDNTVKKRLNNNIELLTKDVKFINSQAKDLGGDDTDVQGLIRDISQWTGKIHEMKSACELLKQSGSSSADSISKLLDALENNLKEQKVGLERKVSAQASKISPVVDKRILDAQKQVNSAEAKAKTSAAELEKSESLVEELTTQLQKKEEEIQNLRGRPVVPDLRRELDVAATKIHLLESKLKTELGQATEKLSTAETEIKGLKEQLGKAEEENKNIGSQKKGLEEQIQKTSNITNVRQDELLKKIETAQAEKQKADEDIQFLNKQIQSLQNPTEKKLGSATHRTEEEIQSLKSDLQKAQQEVTNLKSEIANTSGKSKKQTEELVIKKTELKQVQDEVASLKAQIASLGEDKKLLESAQAALSKGHAGKLQEKDALIGKQTEQTRKAQEEVNTLQADQKVNKQKIQEQENSLAEIKKQLAKAEAELKVKESEFERAEESLFNSLEILEDRKVNLGNELWAMQETGKVKYLKEVKIPKKIQKTQESAQKQIEEIREQRAPGLKEVANEGVVKKTLASQNPIKMQIREALSEDIVNVIDEAYQKEGFQQSLGKVWGSYSNDNAQLTSFREGFQNNIDKLNPKQIKEAFKDTENLIKKGFEQFGELPDQIQTQLRSIQGKIKALEDIDRTGAIHTEVRSDLEARAKIKLEKENFEVIQDASVKIHSEALGKAVKDLISEARSFITFDDQLKEEGTFNRLLNLSKSDVYALKKSTKPDEVAKAVEETEEVMTIISNAIEGWPNRASIDEKLDYVRVLSMKLAEPLLEGKELSKKTNEEIASRLSEKQSADKLKGSETESTEKVKRKAKDDQTLVNPKRREKVGKFFEAEDVRRVGQHFEIEDIGPVTMITQEMRIAAGALAGDLKKLITLFEKNEGFKEAFMRKLEGGQVNRFYAPEEMNALASFKKQGFKNKESPEGILGEAREVLEIIENGLIGAGLATRETNFDKLKLENPEENKAFHATIRALDNYKKLF